MISIMGQRISIPKPNDEAMGVVRAFAFKVAVWPGLEPLCAIKRCAKFGQACHHCVKLPRIVLGGQIAKDAVEDHANRTIGVRPDVRPSSV